MPADWPDLPRISLGHFPTAVEPLDRLSRHLGGPRLWIKRDDCTGLAGGGNKTRKLEYLLGDALAKGATHLLTSGGVQSNHARQTAAAAARCGLRCILILEDSVDGRSSGYYQAGNLLRARLLGAEVRIQPKGTDTAQVMAAEAQALRSSGATPYVIPAGGSSDIGSLAYARAMEELAVQRGPGLGGIATVFVATGSCGTHGGLLAGAAGLDLDVEIRGVCVGKPRNKVEAKLAEVEAELKAVGLPRGFGSRPVLLDDSRIGAGYGQPTPAVIEAIRLLAGLEGILIDPVYTGKAMAGLIAAVRSGELRSDAQVLFWHTGGAQALSAYSADLAPMS